MERVGVLYTAGAIGCEVTPLPGNARQALLSFFFPTPPFLMSANKIQIMKWINGPVMQKVRARAARRREDRHEVFFVFFLSVGPSRVATDSEKGNKKKGRALPGPGGPITAHGASGGRRRYWTLLN